MDNRMLWKISYGMYAVGVKSGERICGCIINTAVQISGNPITIAISMSKDNYTHELLSKGTPFTLSILSEKTPPLSISYLGFQSGKDREKWANVEHELTEAGLPYLTQSCGYLECRVNGSYDAGTHTVFFAEVENATALSSENPMTYDYYHRVVKGKAPKNAPTYQDPKTAQAAVEPATEKWVCTVCGYVHEGALPADFICPVCHATADKFVRK